MNRHPTRQRACAGFSLLEMAMVFAILALLMGGLFVPLSLQMELQQVSKTRQTLDNIKNSLLAHAVVNNGLPCPDTDGDGFADACTGATEGYVPWADLGVGKHDAWNNPMRYRVDAAYINAVPVNSNTGSGLQILDRDLNPVTANNVVVAVLFSCGKNGIPDAANDADGVPDSVHNCGNSSGGTPDAWYTDDRYQADQYDDVVAWISKYTLLNQLVNAERWRP